MVMNNEGEGGPEGGVSVGEDREVGLRVALSNEEKQKWKNRQKQSSSAKQPPGRKPGLSGRNGIARAVTRLDIDSYS